MYRRTVLVLLVSTVVALIGVPGALALSNYYKVLQSIYGGPTTCQLDCHTSENGPPPFTAYGAAFRAQPNYSDVIGGGTKAVLIAIGPPLATINVTPATVSLPVGRTQNFAAATLDSFGNQLTENVNVVWTSSDVAVGTIDSTTGVFTAVGAGTTTITATGGGTGSGTVTGNATTIVSAPTPTPEPTTPTPTPSPITATPTPTIPITPTPTTPIIPTTPTIPTTLTPIPTSIPYVVSVSTSPSGLNPQPTGGKTYDTGTTATVIAQPVTGYMFQGWAENRIQVSTNTSYSFTVVENRTLTAEYIAVPTPGPTSILYTVSVSTLPSDLSPRPTGGGAYYSGNTTMVTAQPVEGYTFQRWTENGNTASTSTSYRFTITNDRNLVAEYSNEIKPSIIVEPDSGPPGSEITIRGTGFNIFKSPHVSIYLDDRVVKERIIVEREANNLSGSFRTTLMVPSDIRSGYYKIIAKGFTDSALDDFEVKYSAPYIWVYIAGISSIIAAVALLKYQEGRIKKSKQLPIKIETRGGVESTYNEEHAIDMDVRGGVERL